MSWVVGRAYFIGDPVSNSFQRLGFALLPRICLELENVVMIMTRHHRAVATWKKMWSSLRSPIPLLGCEIISAKKVTTKGAL